MAVDIGREGVSKVSYIPRGDSFDIVVTGASGKKRVYHSPNEANITLYHTNSPTLLLNPTPEYMKHYSGTFPSSGTPLSIEHASDSTVQSWEIWPANIGYYHRLYSSVNRTYYMKLPVNLESSVCTMTFKTISGMRIYVVAEGNSKRVFEANISGEKELSQFTFPVSSDVRTLWIFFQGVSFGMYEMKFESIRNSMYRNSGTLAQRSSIAPIGHQYYATDTKELSMFDGNQWQLVKQFS